MQIIRNRRSFLTGLSAIGAAGLLRPGDLLAASEPPPETTTVRLPKFARTDCQAAEYVAGELLQAEGFTDILFVTPKDGTVLLGAGELDFDINFVPFTLSAIETGVPGIILTGLHSGCLELFANDSVQSIKDLKGKRVGVDKAYSQPHQLITIMASYIGLDPEEDLEWVFNEEVTAMDLFVRGEIDAFLATPPEPQELRARGIGHTILRSVVDRPWSQYFCCLLSGSRQYVDNYPIATKRVLRAILKAADLCASSPEWVARTMVERGFAERYDYALETLKEIRYAAWREFDPEDSVRFYALRMHELGISHSTPQTIIEDGTNWRFLNELKRELKA
jgi:NitT/TauT family transport system substrate-binding protein